MDRKTGSVFWVEQTFPKGRRVLFQRGADGPIQWSKDEINVTNSVHEYGGGSFCVDDGKVFICHDGGVSQLTHSKAEPRKIVYNGEGEDIRYADLHLSGKYIYAVQEVHPIQGEDKLVPKNNLVRINIDPDQAGKVDIIVS